MKQIERDSSTNIEFNDNLHARHSGRNRCLGHVKILMSVCVLNGINLHQRFSKSRTAENHLIGP